MPASRPTILQVAVPAFAAATVLAAGLALGQLAPSSPVPPILPLAPQHIARAAVILNGPHGREPAALAQAETEARRALADGPARADAWLTIAYVERQRAGEISPAVAKALDRSYVVGPLDPDVAMWRIGFCFENWADLSRELRGDALRELTQTWSLTGFRDDLRRLSGQIADPTGRLAMRLQITLMERSEGDLRSD